MRRWLSMLAMPALVAGTSPASAADQICARLRTLATARPAPGDEPGRRWIEFHWGNAPAPDTIWSWGCRWSQQRVAHETCDWLVDNTSKEVSARLLVRILSCYGYRFPPGAAEDWRGVEGAFELHDRGGGLLVLEVARRNLAPGEIAMRLTVLGPEGYYDPDEMPPIEPLPADAG